MSFGLFIKSFIIFVAGALIAFALSPLSLVDLFKLLALAVGLSLITPFIYPHIRGVKKGDALLVINYQSDSKLIQATSGIALENGRKGTKIRIVLPNGTQIEGIITNYAGFLTPAQAKVVENELITVI